MLRLKNGMQIRLPYILYRWNNDGNRKDKEARIFMKKNFRNVFKSLLCVVFIIEALVQPLTVKAEESEWDYGYTGNVQEYVVPYTGVFQFEVSGAQGGNAVFPGGKGGRVTATVVLKKGDKVRINVGGQNGYNGGGTGSVSNGGGATDIYVNDVRIIVAGGGGGGNAGFEGGAGGTDSISGNESGEGISISEGAGGGAGYYGGKAGIQHIVEHIHEGNEKSGGKCYTPVYHKHSGSSSAGGGCYTIPVYHVHNDNCYNEGYWCVWGEPYYAGGIVRAWVSICECGAQSVSSMASGCSIGNHEYHRGSLKCTKSETETIESYSLACGKTTNSIVGYTFSCDKVYDEYEVVQSEGGTNWCDSDICNNAVSEAGVQEGNGMCRMKMLSLFNLFYNNAVCYNVYYGETRVQKVYFNNVLIYKSE